MICNTKQNWSVGSRVKVGFMSLTVTGAKATPGDGYPDEYYLVSDKGVKYVFTPHNGLSRDWSAQ